MKFVSDAYTKGKETHLPKSRHGAQLVTGIRSTCCNLKRFPRRAIEDGQMRRARQREIAETRHSDGRVSLEYASTNMPQEIGVSKRVGNALAGLARCMSVDSGFSYVVSLGTIDVHVGVFDRQGAALPAIGRPSPYKMRQWAERNLRVL